MRVLLDTNVLVSAVLFGGLPRELVRRALRGDFEVVTSPGLMTELEDVLVERFSVGEELARVVRSEYELLAIVVRPAVVPRLVRDPDDDAVLAAAVSGEVDFVVTGDQDLLALGTHEGRGIVTPRAFQDRLNEIQER